MAESIGIVYPTLIPEYEESADIQAALTLYHYGTLDTVSGEEDVVPNSIAGHLLDLQNQVDIVEARKYGSEYSGTAPEDKDDGYIWVDSETEGIQTTFYSKAYYTATAPTEDLITGIIWVDTSTESRFIKVWDGTQNEWVTTNEYANIVTVKGDLIGTDSDGDIGRFPVGVNGYILTADSSKEFGIDWKQLPQEEDKLLYIMGIF
jgi:hypothetical protein